MRNTHAQYRRQHRIRGSTQRSSRRHAKTAHQRGSRICVLQCCQPSGQGYLRDALVARHHVASVTPSTRASGEMADALASGASVRKDVGVQVPPRALLDFAQNLLGFSFINARTEAKYAGQARIRSDCEKNLCGIRSLRYSIVPFGPRSFSEVLGSNYT